MIHIFYNKISGATDCLIKAHCKEELVADFRSFLGAICKDPDIMLIFFEEFNDITKVVEKRLKDDQNGTSNKSDEQSDK